MNGINLDLKFKDRPSDQQLRELQYNLMHRFGPQNFNMIADGGKKAPFVGIVESHSDETWVEILVRGNYYHIGCEYGDGLPITGVLLYLSRRYPEAEIWYRPENDEGLGENELKFDEEQSLMLLYHFLDYGSLPAMAALTGLLNRECVESPSCSFCGVPMMRESSRSRTAHFYCAGCLETITLEGEDYDKWVREGKRVNSPCRYIDLGDVGPF